MPLVKAKIRIGFNALPDHQFISYPIASQKVPTEGITFSVISSPLEALERRALRKELEVCAMSAFTFMQVANHYSVIPCAMTSGNNFGPVLVARHPCYARDLQGKRIATDGLHTGSYYLLKLFLESFEAVEPKEGSTTASLNDPQVEAALLTGPEQMDYAQRGWHKVADLGEWFYEQTRLPLVLSVFGIRKTLGRDVMRKVTRLLRDTVLYSLKQPEEVLKAVSVGMADPSAQAFRAWLGRYVDEEILEPSKKVRSGFETLMEAAAHHGLCQEPKSIEYVQM